MNELQVDVTWMDLRNNIESENILRRELGCEELLADLLILSLITGLDSIKEQRLRGIVVIVSSGLPPCHQREQEQWKGKWPHW